MTRKAKRSSSTPSSRRDRGHDPNSGEFSHVPEFRSPDDKIAGSPLRSDRAGRKLYLVGAVFFAQGSTAGTKPAGRRSFARPVGAAEVYPAGAAPGPTFRGGHRHRGDPRRRRQVHGHRRFSLRLQETFKLSPELLLVQLLVRLGTRLGGLPTASASGTRRSGAPAIRRRSARGSRSASGSWTRSACSTR